ncbi:MAG: permease, partial [Cocleimonas sp.]
MSQLDIGSGQIVANAAENERASFIKRTYVHLAGAIAVFAVVETALLQSGVADSFMSMLAGSSWSWLIVMGAFMLVSTVANNWAHSNISREKQYMGLGLF